MAEEEKKPAPIELPDLKKQEKERKKAGVAYTGGGAGGSPFTGATGGSGAVGSGAAGSAASGGARAAAAAARAGTAGIPGATGVSGEISGGILSRLAQIMARVTATWAGKAAVMASVAVVMGGAIVVMKAMNAAPQAGGPDLGGLSSSISVDRGGNNAALDYAARAARGLALNKGPAAGKSDQAAAAPDTAKDAPPAGDAAKADGNFASRPGEGANKDLMENNLAGAKLSSSLGGGTFGGKDIFSKPDSPSKFGEAMRGGLSRLGFGSLDKGRSSKMTKAAGKGSRSVALGRHGMKSSKALAQLRGMSTLNSAMRAGGTGAGETQSGAATTQFEGVEPIGGTAPTSPVDGAVPASLPGNTPTSGGSTNDISNACTQEQINEGWVSNGASCVPGFETPSFDDKTPWKKLVSQGKTILIIATILTLIAGILGILGNGFLATGCSAYVGSLILAIVRVIATIIAIVLGGMLFMIGDQIAQMGGKQQGMVMSLAGGAVVVGAAMTIFGNIYPIATIVGMLVSVLAAAMGALI